MTKISLASAARRLNILPDVAFAACDLGLYGDLVIVKETLQGISRYTYEERLPSVLERTWEYVLYHRPSKAVGSQQGPWVPTEEVARWLADRVGLYESNYRTPGDGSTPADVRLWAVEAFAHDLGVHPRIMWRWLNCEYEYISYTLLEDVLWKYALLRPEDICSREQMVITKPRKRSKND